MGIRASSGALFALVASIAVASPAVVLADDLREALVQTYLTNPRLEGGRARLNATDELVPQALAGWRPQVFIDAGAEAVRGQGRLVDAPDTIDSDRDTSRIGLNARQNLYQGGGTVAATNRAENLVRAERANLLALEQSVLLEAIDAYTAAWRDRAVLELALNNETRLKRQLQATRDRFQVGDLARTDVAQAEARLSRARADVEAAKANLASSYAFYERVIGKKPGELEQPKDLPPLPSSLAEAQALAETNPEVIQATFALSAARDDVDVARADLLPSVDLSADLAYVDEPTTSLEWQRQGSVGINVTIPLYQGGGEYARVRQNRQIVRQRRNDLELAHRTVQERAASAYDQLLAATAAIDAFRSEVRANDIALKGVEEENLVGVRTVLDVLDAEQELFESQVNLVRAQRTEITAAYQLKAATGELTVVDLELPVEPYDAQAYYQRTRNRLFGLDDLAEQP
ncbi:TolC family outer membrane protein [Geminicoccaceae bacterium 1502E]|nr:TolC family outer membrane protein [Geminicoccaceae bacterium 1502E]